jgi:phage-related protein
VAEYTLGSARGQIRIEYDSNGVRRARDDMGRFSKETDRGGIRIANFAEKLVAMGTAAVAAGPGVIALAGAATAAGAAYASAGIAAGAFFAAVKGQMTSIEAVIDGHAKAEEAVEKYGKGSEQAKKAQEAYKQQLAGIPPATRQTALAFLGLKDDFQKWSDSLAGTTMPIFTRGINILRQVLPLLTPLVRTVATVLDGLMTELEAGVRGGGLAKFIAGVNKSASETLPKLINTIKNVVQGVVGFFRALSQNAGDVTGTIERASAAFAAWGASLPSDPGFAAFMEQMREGGGKTAETLKDLVLIVKNLIIAFGPFAGATLIIVQALAAFTEAIPVPVLRVLIGLVIAVNVALRVYAATQIIVTTATKAWAVAQRLLNLAFLTNPLFLIIAAIVAVIAIIVLIATRTTWFQTIWDKVWGAVKNIAIATWDFIVMVVKKGFEILKFLFLNFTGPGLILKHFNTIKSVVMGAINFVINFVKNNWQKIVAILLGPLGIAVGLIIKYWDNIKRAFSSAISAVVGMVRSFNSSIANAISRVVNTLANLRNRIFSIFSGAGNWLYNAGRNIITGLINGIISMFNSLRNTLSSVTRALPDWKGPPATDRKLLQPTGRMILGGLITGIKRELPQLQNMLGSIGPSTIIPAVVGSGGVQSNAPALAAQTAGRAVSSAAQAGTLDYGRLANAIASALSRQGVGTVLLDGKEISNTVGRLQGREASYKRRAR